MNLKNGDQSCICKLGAPVANQVHFAHGVGDFARPRRPRAREPCLLLGGPVLHRDIRRVSERREHPGGTLIHHDRHVLFRIPHDDCWDERRAHLRQVQPPSDNFALARQSFHSVVHLRLVEVRCDLANILQFCDPTTPCRARNFAAVNPTQEGYHENQRWRLENFKMREKES